MTASRPTDDDLNFLLDYVENKLAEERTAFLGFCIGIAQEAGVLREKVKQLSEPPLPVLNDSRMKVIHRDSLGRIRAVEDAT